MSRISLIALVIGSLGLVGSPLAQEPHQNAVSYLADLKSTPADPQAEALVAALGRLESGGYEIASDADVSLQPAPHAPSYELKLELRYALAHAHKVVLLARVIKTRRGVHVSSFQLSSQVEVDPRGRR